MQIKIGRFEFTECWDGVLYKNLSDYPDITDWEIQTVLDFVKYESMYGRECGIQADLAILEAIKAYKPIYDGGVRVPAPGKITECTACPMYKGCLTDLVCHTTSVDNATEILKCGSLLSPVKARKLPAEVLRSESRNAANDPEDYFEYIMFAWGNCQAGDRLVMERKLRRFPDENDLSEGFTPGVRFFFKYDELVKHPGATFDGVLPLKVKDEVMLAEWVYAIIVPSIHRELIEQCVPDNLKSRVHYIEHDREDIWSWAEKVYGYVKSL